MFAISVAFLVVVTRTLGLQTDLSKYLGEQIPKAEAEADTSPDLRDVFRMVASDGRCLNFLHIPKTAGSSIEKDSKVLAHWVNNSGVHGWGINDKKLQCAHPFGLETRLPWGGDGHRCMVPFEGGKQHCDKRHVPPSLDETIRAKYAECETFCVVRNPIDRIISEARYSEISCNVTEIEKFVAEFVNVTQLYPGSGPGAGWRGHIGCHGVHQTEYVYGGMYNYSKAGEYCQHVLRYENLVDDFDKLMAEFDLPVKLDSHKKDHHCDAVISNRTTQLIKDYYAMDFETFGY